MTYFILICWIFVTIFTSISIYKLHKINVSAKEMLHIVLFYCTISICFLAILLKFISH